MVNYQLLFGLIGAAVTITGILIRGARLSFRTLIGTLIMAVGVFCTISLILYIPNSGGQVLNLDTFFLGIAVTGVLPVIVGFILLDKRAAK